MAAIYPSLVKDWPNYSKGIYERTHHKRVEFWFKTCFLQGMPVESVEIRRNDTELYHVHSYNIYSSSKMKRGSWNIDGGNCKVTISKNDLSHDQLSHIVENIKSSQKSFSYVDVVLRNCNTNNILQLNMISSINLLPETETHHIFNMHYLAMKA